MLCAVAVIAKRKQTFRFGKGEKAMSNDLLTLYRRIREAPAMSFDLPEEYGKGRIEHLETNTFSLSSWNLIAEAVPDAV